MTQINNLKLINENKSDLAELNQNIQGTESKISALIDKKMVNSNEKLDESLTTIKKLEVEKKVYTETHDRERSEQKNQILDLHSEIKSSNEIVHKEMEKAVQILTEDKKMNLTQHEDVAKV